MTPTPIELGDSEHLQQSLRQQEAEVKKLPAEKQKEALRKINPKPRMVLPTRVGEEGDRTRIYFLDDNDEEILFMFKCNGASCNLLLKRNMGFPAANRLQLAESGFAYLFLQPNREIPAVQWSYTTQITKDDIQTDFDIRTNPPITGKYCEDPKRDGTDSLLMTAVIYSTESEAAKGPDEGQYIVLLEIGSADSEDGGLVQLFQGRELSDADINFV